MAILTDMTPAQATALWSGLMILLMVVLSVRVVLARRGNRVVLGDGGNAQVTLSSRVFGNAAEYIPVGIAALVALTLLGLPAYAIHAVGGTLLLGRLLHAVGLSDRKPTAGRVGGMMLTYLALFVAAGMLVIHAFVGSPHG
ncbi:MAPEG family protein [Brevundimonas subvibrioides]|uniref:Membrane-associated protein in eicosanoid and glutathione metabolism (MAPEG) n=1 Tax=Brevundimonas subvibrioides (strain ATCC 15264 / DSM 4735 / LMG 14903 / NBRC 16000 / CB 81) TaxID=633149 RepID=D9QHK6_BRESC|nr:MAPEG family protein [Brevundimonas subvibrioides]ADL01172.1 membrane-associated protein in eicosanoid and glutathione metabolism (MAPEG) [Brevundimonas subvibrioides ATCC 15264]